MPSLLVFYLRCPKLDGGSWCTGSVLLVLFILWLAGRIVVLFPDLLGEELTTIIDLSFLPAVAFVLGKPIIAIKQYRNLFFVPLLLLFTIANSEMHLAIYNSDTFTITYAAYAGVMLVTFLMSVMAGRVVPMFTANGTQTPKATPLPLVRQSHKRLLRYSHVVFIIRASSWVF